MHNRRFSHFLFTVLASFGIAVGARATDAEPYLVPLGYAFKISAGEANLYVDNGLTNSAYYNTSGGAAESPDGATVIRPGQEYNFAFSGGLTPCGAYSIGLIAPSGYRFYVDGQPKDMIQGTITTSWYATSFKIQLRPVLGSGFLDAGVFTGFDIGQAVSWELGAGGLMSGHSVGRISFREQDLSNSPASRDRLLYTAPLVASGREQVNAVRDGGSGQTLRQLASPQKVLDFVDETVSGVSGYWVKYYNYDDMDLNLGTGRYDPKSGKTPWRTIRVETPASNQLRIIETEGSVSRASHLSLTGGSVSSGNYVWTLQEGSVASGTYTWLRTTTHTSTKSGGTRENVVTVRTGGTGGTIVSETKYIYNTYAWGEDLYQVVANPNGSSPNVLTTTYDYYATAPSSGSETYRGSYRRVKSVTGPDGGWTAYEYYDDWNKRGQTKYQYAPNLDSPSSVTLDPTQGRVQYFEYVSDSTGRYRWPSLHQEKTANVVTAKTVWDYTGSSLPLIKANVDSYKDGTYYHRTYTETVDPNSGDVNEENEPAVVKNPDLSQVSWSRGMGDYNAGTKVFTYGGSYFWRELKVSGSSSSSGATSVSSYDSQSFPAVYAVANKSTLEITIRSVAGYVLRSETRYYTGSGWSAPISAVDSTYNAQCRLEDSTALNGAVTDYTYTNGYVSSVVGGDGVETRYTYDGLGRTDTVKKVGVSSSGSYAAQEDLTTTYAYDGANRSLSETVSASGTVETIFTSRAYDSLGRVISATPPGVTATTFSYNAASRTQTSTAPDGGTSIRENYRDGRPKSITGTAVVAQYYTYGVETDGRRYTRTDFGVSSSARWAKAWSDWLGRGIESRAPGFSVSSQADSVTQNYYDNTTGQLTKTTRTGYDPTLYVYNTLGQMTRSGLDAGNGGSLVLASSDRIVDTDTSFESYSSALWLKQTTTIYPLASSATAFTSSIARTRLSGFSGSLRAETQATDAEGNTATSTTTISSKTVTQTTTAPGMANSALAVSYNGIAVGATGFDGLVSLAEMDKLGRPYKSTDPRSLVTTTAYYAGTALPQTVTDSASQVIATYAYDTSGRVKSLTDVLSATAYTAYDKLSRPIRQWGSSTYPVEYEYDATYGDRTKLRTWRTSPVDFTHATAFEPVNYAYPATTGDATVWSTDTASAQIWKKTDAAGKAVEFDYNTRGQMASRKWARKLTAVGYTTTPVTTTYGYDSSTGELLTTSYNDSVESIPTPGLTYTYTRSGQVATVADGAGTRTFAYQSGAPWRLDYEALPSFYDSRRITRLYESSSGTSGSFNGYTKGTVKGRDVGFDLGVSGTPARDLHQQYTASNLGRFVGVTGQANGGTAQDFVYAYKSGARLLDGYAAGSFSTTRDYESTRDLMSKIESKWSTTTVTRFDFTYNNRYERVTAKQSGTAYADYYSGGAYSSVFNNYTYNLKGELQTSAMYRGDTTTPTPSYELPGRRFEYRYDPIGNRITAGATGSADSADDEYTTNAVNQYTAKENNTVRFLGTKKAAATVGMSDVTLGTKDRAWGGDLVPANSGGAVQGTATLYSALPGAGSGGADVIRSETKAWFAAPGSQAMIYDDDGNLTGDGVFTYTWNAENQLVRAASALASGAGFLRQRLDFKYDYLGRRTEKRVTNIDTSTETIARRFVYDGWNLVAELNANTPATILRSYAWGLDLVGDFTKSGGIGALLRMTNYSSGSPGTSYYPTYDGNGNVASLLNASTGAIAATYEYDPFGNYLRNEAIDSAVADNPFKFSTKYADPETGFSYYGHRYYSPGLGRFINKDPIEESGGLNLYGFCANNGVNRWDYLGMAELSFSGAPDPSWSQVQGSNGFFYWTDGENNYHQYIQYDLSSQIDEWFTWGNTMPSTFADSYSNAYTNSNFGWLDAQIADMVQQNHTFSNPTATITVTNVTVDDDGTVRYLSSGKVVPADTAQKVNGSNNKAAFGMDNLNSGDRFAPNNTFGQSGGAGGATAGSVHGQELLNSCGPGSVVIAVALATGSTPTEPTVRNAIAQAIGKQGFNFAQQGLNAAQVRTGIPGALGQFGAKGDFRSVIDSKDIASTLSGGNPVIFGVLNPSGPGNHLMVVQYGGTGPITGTTMLQVSNPWPANNSPAPGNPGQSYQISLDDLNKLAVGPAIVVTPR